MQSCAGVGAFLPMGEHRYLLNEFSEHFCAVVKGLFYATHQDTSLNLDFVRHSKSVPPDGLYP